jgi:hypothetical protein
MGRLKSLWALLALVLTFATNAKAELAFTQPSFTFTATTAQTFTLDLNTLLTATPTAAATWAIPTGLPSWLTLDSANHKLFGTPVAGSGGGTFQLFAQNAENGTSTQIVINVLAPPVWNIANIDLGIQNEGTAFTYDLTKNIASNPGGGTVTFTSPNLPSWMTLTAAGILSGTPQRANVGNYRGIIFVATANGGPAQATGSGQVLITIHPPVWTQTPIALATVLEDSNFSSDLSKFVMNYEGSALTYSIASPVPPAWLSMTSTGTLFGTPGAAAVGAVTLDVQIDTDIQGQHYTVKDTVQFTVQHVNHPPVWAENPLSLPSAFTGVAYTQTLAGSASDPDAGDTLTFSLVSGPAWVKVSSTGVVTGTPDGTVVGANSFVVAVTDQGGLSAQTTVNLTVIQSPLPPYWLTHPVVLANGTEDQAFSADLTKFSKDPQNNPMVYVVVSAPSWLSVSSAGLVTGTPNSNNIGLTKITVRVSDNVAQGNDVADIMVNVIHVNHPPQWTLNPIQISTPEEKAFTLDVSPYAIDNDKSSTDATKTETSFLVFSQISGPTWAQLSAKGIFTGTPPDSAEGANTFVVRTADPEGATADVQVVITVTHINHPPVFSQNPIVLPDAKEQVAYANSIASFASDPDKGDTLTFSKISGPAWVTVNSDGSISGTPAHTDIGTAKIIVQVSDSSNATATAEVDIPVDMVPQPPYWRQHPVQLGNAYEDKTFTFDLMNPVAYAASPNNEKLTFSKVAGPDWVIVSSAGVITGVPGKADVGNFQVTLRVQTPENLYADEAGVGVVIHTAHPPVISAPGPTYTLKERQVVTNSIKSFITDQDGLAITCSLVDTASWVQLTTDCNLTLSPLHANIGDATFRFTATDTNPLSASGVITVHVLADPRPPQCQSPIAFDAKTNQAFSASVANDCQDLDGRPLTYTKTTGSAWLTVNTAGALSGTPKDADFGDSKYTVHVCNDASLCVDALVDINVKYGTKIDTIAIDSPVPNAPSEQLWVVDNSSRCAAFIRALKEHVNEFFSALTTAQVTFSNVMISSDTREYSGLPIKGVKNGPDLMLWSDGNLVTDFQKRVDNAYSGGPCSNCDNSPLWSMSQFYRQAPTISDIFHNGYFVANEPMDAMVVTNQLDHFPRYANNTPEQSWEVADYSKSFTDFHLQQHQSLRISAIAPECQGFVEGSQSGENPYKELVDSTNGSNYPLECRFDMTHVMQDFASKVIFRAYVFAKHTVKLSQAPTDPTTVQVTINGQEVVGNTGAATDVWTYDAANNQIIIHWELVDPSLIKAGAKLDVSYRVS